MSDSIRDFFSTAILVDDELTTKPELTQLIQTFQALGVVISPVLFNAAGITEQQLHDQVSSIVTLAKKAKLCILDWHLDNATPIAAKTIIRQLVESGAGMKWVVVYTQDPKLPELPANLASELKDIWTKARRSELADDASTATLHASLEEPIRLGSVYVTFVSKDVNAEGLYQQFREALGRQFGFLSQTLLHLAAAMETKSYQVMSEFAKPFDLSLYLHALSAGLNARDTAAFLFQLYSDNVRTDKFAEAASQIEEHKVNSVAKLVSLKRDQPDAYNEICAILRKETLRKEGSWGVKIGWLDLPDKLADVTSVSDLSQRMDQLVSQLKDEERMPFRSLLEVLCAYAEWRDHNPTASLAVFFRELDKQRIHFTRLLKFKLNVDESKREPIQTGSIFYDPKSEKYLLCVTPVCDTAHGSKVDYKYKFVVGTAAGVANPVDRKNRMRSVKDSYNRHGTFIPVGDDQIQYVVWDFYHTIPIERTPLDAWLATNCAIEHYRDNRELIRPYLTGLHAIDPRFKRAVLSLIEESGDSECLTELRAQLAPIERGLELDPAHEVLKGFPGHSRELETYKFLGCLKGEYAQQIINRYAAYASRAGVDELYFKETPALLGLFHEAVEHAGTFSELRETYQLGPTDAEFIDSTATRKAWFVEKVAEVGTPVKAALVFLLRGLSEDVLATIRVAKHPMTTARLTELLDLCIPGDCITPQAAGEFYEMMLATGESAAAILEHNQQLQRMSDDATTLALLSMTETERGIREALAASDFSTAAGRLAGKAKQVLKKRVEPERLLALVGRVIETKKSAASGGEGDQVPES